MISIKPIIGVMGSHEDSWDEYSLPLGKLIADYDYHLLTGAGGGVMTSVSKSFTEVEHRHGSCIGVVPTMQYDGNYVANEEFPNPYIEIPILTHLDSRAQNDAVPYSRNYVNIMSSHALVFLPGEHGTRNEVSLAIQYKKPMILFGPENAFIKFPDAPVRVQDISEVKEFLEKATSKYRKNG